MDPDKSMSTENFIFSVNGCDHIDGTTHKDPPLNGPIIDDDKEKEAVPSMGLGRASTNSDTSVVDLLNVRVTSHKDNHTASDSAKTTTTSSSTLTMISTAPVAPLIWSWPHEHADRKREREADESLHGRHGTTHYIYGSHSMPFEVDRKLLKDLVREKMGDEVGRIEFMSAGMSPFLVIW
jgi:hypothetical protein